MSSKLIVGPIDKGYTTNRLPFNIDNDAFPVLINAYQWRGRIKRKRGNEFLGRLTRYFNSSSITYNPTSIVITLDGSGNGNLITGYSLQTIASIVPGNVTIVGAAGPITYTDPTEDGYLTPTGTGGANTINYATGAILIPAQSGQTITATFNYYPDLPVLGLEDFITTTNAFPQTLGFDTTYSYNILPVEPYSIYDVSFYKNPPASASLPGYTPKTNWTPTSWNSQNYQQIWATNYQGAFWATNGITIPFTKTNVGMQYSAITNVAAPGANTVVITVSGPNLVVGDFVFLNEFDPAIIKGINFQTGYVIAGSSPGAITVELPYASLSGAGGATTKGIVQYLTNRSDITKDCIRWYDGDPTNGSPVSPSFVQGSGWVNFAPPLSQNAFSIADAPAAQYYLVGARLILPFKDRLVFFGPVIQTSTPGSQIYLQDTIVFSQNGTPYYTASYFNTTDGTTVFTADIPTSSAITFHPILVPTNQTATSPAYFTDQTGFGGWLSAGLDQPINVVSPNEDVLILGLNTIQARMVYTGNDIVPFNIFVINSELGSTSTFSLINMDQGILSRGSRGYIITSQTSAQRIDLDIPDQVFQINNLNNGTERFCAARDFINEWIYFTYNSNRTEGNSSYVYPNQTLQYNYRDNSWAIFNETFTTYGSFRKQTGFTWATVGNVYPTWDQWNDPWGAGESTLLQQTVIAGNQQGFLFIRASGTGEGTSLEIQDISSSVVTSPDHCLNLGDYIMITGCLGTVGSLVNGKIFSVGNVMENTFVLNPSITSGTYFGGGLITRLYAPFIQTKQFPLAWGLSRKTRIGTQQYLLSKTGNGQLTLLIFLSTDNTNPYNNPEFPFPVQIIPALNSQNDSLIYSTVLYTCPESTNLGLTPANTNLQELNLIGSNGTSTNNQQQIWHRINTSLIGDTVQLGFTLNDEQMRTLDSEGGLIFQISEIELHGFIVDVSPSMMLS